MNTCQLLEKPTASDVEIEEIGVQDGLNDSSHNSNRVEERFGVVAEDPVQDVESTVGSESKQVMGSNGFSRSRTR